MKFKKNEDWSFPLEYDKNCHFYEEYMIMDGNKYPYSELSTIIYSSERKNVNGISISNNIEMSLSFIEEDFIPFPMNEKYLTGIAQFSYQRGLIPTNNHLGKLLDFIHVYLSKKTLEQRLKRHLKSLEIYGKFSFWEGLPTFFNNGDLFDNGKFEGNFKEMFEKNKIIDGEKYGSYKNKVNNPYIYGFEKGTKFFGLIVDKVEFGNTINRDIMYILFNNLYKNGKMNKF